MPAARGQTKRAFNLSIVTFLRSQIYAVTCGPGSKAGHSLFCAPAKQQTMPQSTAADIGLDPQQLAPQDGFHCGHFFYRFDRAKLAALDVIDAENFERVLSPAESEAPARIQIGLVSGHKADFSLMVMDPDPIKVESVNQQLLATTIGQTLVPTWSYISLSEISEYVQSPEQYRDRLIRSGEDPSGTAIETKVEAYSKRLVKMNHDRLTPNFPIEGYPASCFYPMNKWRYPGANWFGLSSSERNKLMSEHARSGMKFAGKVKQLITVGVCLLYTSPSPRD